MIQLLQKFLRNINKVHLCLSKNFLTYSFKFGLTQVYFGVVDLASRVSLGVGNLGSGGNCCDFCRFKHLALPAAFFLFRLVQGFS